ncbi:MAG: substrate-binding domain-containing protein [Planctomycetota bacterium]|nr:substrate-binding domain-containing protein [Planctomycetota bacterium]
MSRPRTSLFRTALVVSLTLALGCVPSSDGGGASDASGGGNGKSGAKRIILLTNGDSPFWDACRVGLQEAEKNLKLPESGLAAIMEVNDGTPGGQLDKLRQFASQSDIVGVAVSALDASNPAVADALKGLQEKGVHVVCVDSDIDREKFRDARSYYIGTDNYVGGRELGIAAKHLLQARKVKTGKYVQFVGRTGAQNAMERMDGFKDAVGTAYEEAYRMGDEMDRTRARENVRNAMINHRDLVALVGIWSYNAPAIVDVVKQEDKRDDYSIVVFDAEPAAVVQMGQGFIDVMIVQNPYEMGYQAVRLLNAMLEDDKKTIQEMFPDAGKKDGDIYDTGLKAVVPDEKSPLKAEMFGKTTKFLTLGEFKKWLDEYNLTGS